jgi:hypothetical protein
MTSHNPASVERKSAKDLLRQADDPWSLPRLHRELVDAHAFLVTAAQSSVTNLAAMPRDHWGTLMKRAPVELPTQGRPELVSPAIESHNFGEIVNQCATLERLIEAVAWAANQAELTSKSFSKRLSSPTRHGLKRGFFRYETRFEGERTVIFEVRQGPDPKVAANGKKRPKRAH